MDERNVEKAIGDLWSAVETGRNERRQMLIAEATITKDVERLEGDLNGMGGRMTRSEAELEEKINGTASRLADELHRLENLAIGEEGKRKAALAETKSAMKEGMTEAIGPLVGRVDALESNAENVNKELASLTGSARIIIWLLSGGGIILLGLGADKLLGS